MGILNLSPDSFFIGSHVSSPEMALERAILMVEQGATIIDIGAESTQPKLHPTISCELELERLLPALRLLIRELPIPISVDTSKADVIRVVADLGISLINDTRALREPGALSALAETNLSVCLMHMQFPHGAPQDRAHNVYPSGVISEVKQFLAQRISACLEAGIAPDRIWVDPGIGAGNFGKSCDENLELLRNLAKFKSLGFPLLVGISRKTFIGELLGIPPEERLAGSLAATTWAVAQGADVIRTHDVRETVEAVKVVNAIRC